MKKADDVKRKGEIRERLTTQWLALRRRFSFRQTELKTKGPPIRTREAWKEAWSDCKPLFSTLLQRSFLVESLMVSA